MKQGSLLCREVSHLQPICKLAALTLLNLGTSVILLVVYGAYLFFQLKSHTEMYNQPSPKAEKIRNKVSEGDASRGIAQIGQMTATLGAQNPEQLSMSDPGDEPETPQLSIWVAIFTLAASTALVALCAEFMVRSVACLCGSTLLIHSSRLIPSMRSLKGATFQRPSSD